MTALTEEQVQVVEEIIWLAKHAQSSRRSYQPANGFIDVLNDVEALKRAFDSETVQERILRRFIDGLANENRVILQAVMCLGTGEQEKKDFPHLLRHFANDYDDAGEYLCSKADLSAKVLSGLRKLGIKPEMKLTAQD